jgi:hypothetical protein
MIPRRPRLRNRGQFAADSPVQAVAFTREQPEIVMSSHRRRKLLGNPHLFLLKIPCHFAKLILSLWPISNVDIVAYLVHLSDLPETT